MSAGRVGGMIKKLRKEKGFTIKMMAEYTGLSAGYLSTLERDMTSPTLDNLYIICDTLGVDLTRILIPDKNQNPIVRKEDWKVHEYQKLNQNLYEIDFGYNEQKYEYVTIAPGEPEDTSEFRHLFDEVGTVIEGEMMLQIDGEVLCLKAGDSVYIQANKLHRIYNEKAERCVSFWVYKIKS